jgi:hypothetical protein
VRASSLADPAGTSCDPRTERAASFVSRRCWCLLHHEARLLSYRIDPDDGIVYLTGSQTATLDEFRRVVSDAADDPAFKPHFGFIRDRRGLEAPTGDELRGAVAFVVGTVGLQRTRWAIIVDTPANYGMMRMAGFLADNSPLSVAIFATMEEAVTWLKSPPQEQSA